mmetsp:Transcript_57374/g.134329  ORF Transcript_57374/g.134329 Transcript_57374/m.134329 type:complete len:207 (+) Transcript_57374:285-905(+)
MLRSNSPCRRLSAPGLECHQTSDLQEYWVLWPGAQPKWPARAGPGPHCRSEFVASVMGASKVLSTSADGGRSIPRQLRPSARGRNACCRAVRGRDCSELSLDRKPDGSVELPSFDPRTGGTPSGANWLSDCLDAMEANLFLSAAIATRWTSLSARIHGVSSSSQVGDAARDDHAGRAGSSDPSCSCSVGVADRGWVRWNTMCPRVD